MALNAGAVTVRVAAVLVLVVLPVGCSRTTPAPEALCTGDVGPAHVVMEGDDFGRWRLVAYQGWEGHPYGLVFDHPKASRGCGTVGMPDAALGSSGGGFDDGGRQVRYVYGAVLPPVVSVVVRFEDGSDIEVLPRAVRGMRHRFFATVTPAPGGWQVEALDAKGEVVAQQGTGPRRRSGRPAGSRARASDPERPFGSHRLAVAGRRVGPGHQPGGRAGTEPPEFGSGRGR